MKTVRRWLPALWLLAAACGGRGDLYTREVKPLPLLATDDALVAVVPQTQRVVRIRKGESPRTLPLGEGARKAVRVKGELLAVLAGTQRHPLLQLVWMNGEVVKTLELPGAYDDLAFSEDGRYGVLTYSAAGLTPGVVARNLNEVAVVDVEAATVTRLSLGSESLAPRSVLFAPPREERQLVAIALDRGVVIFDARSPERPPRRIPTRLTDTQPEASVQEGLFSPGGGVLFLRISGMDDVFAVELGSAGGELSASVNFLSGGTGLSDIALLSPTAPDAEHRVLAVYAHSQEARVLDARGLQDAPRLTLDVPLTSAHVLSDGRVLLHDPRLRNVVAWEPSTGKSGAALLSAGFDAVRFSDALGAAVFRHPSTEAGGAALTVATLREEVNGLRVRLQPIAVSRQVQADVMDESRGRLYFAPQGLPVLVRLEVGTLALEQLTLDAPVTALHYLPAQDVLVAVHGAPAPEGDVTLIPASQLERGAAERVRFFVYTDALALAEERP